MCASLASVTGQIFKGVETAARMQNIGYKDAPQAAQPERFGIQIILSQDPNKPPAVDVAPKKHIEASDAGHQVTVRRRSFACDFDLKDQE